MFLRCSDYLKTFLYTALFLFGSTLANAQSTAASISAISAITTTLLSSECNDPNHRTISGPVNITSQSGAASLFDVNKIEGDLVITSGHNLSISALNNLVEVTGDIRIVDNPFQINLIGFHCLAAVGGSIVIDNNARLREIGGFNRLKTITYDIFISDNDVVNTFSGFDALEELGHMTLYDLKQVSRIPLFTHLRETRGSLDIRRATRLTNLSSFPNLLQVKGALRINENRDLQEITGFGSLTHSNVGFSFSGSVKIEVINNPNLDCTNPYPNFYPADASSGNAVDC